MLTDDYFLGTKLYSKKFAELCKPISDYLGNITSAHYVHINKDGTGFVIYTLEKWAERVLEKQHYKNEIGIVHPDNMHNGFSFCNASDNQEYKNELLYDGAVNFNWTHSFCYIEKNPKNDTYVGLGFGADKNNFQIVNKLLNGTQTIKKLIKKLNHQLTAVIKKDLIENRADVAKLRGEDIFSTQKGLIYNPYEENVKKINLLKNTGLYDDNLENFLDANLSPQEVNCLREYLISHNIKRVALTLGLAETTVSSYMENIKLKFNCVNKNQLLEKGYLFESLGYI